MRGGKLSRVEEVLGMPLFRSVLPEPRLQIGVVGELDAVLILVLKGFCVPGE